MRGGLRNWRKRSTECVSSRAGRARNQIENELNDLILYVADFQKED